MFIDDGVLVGVYIVGEGTGRSGPEMRKKLVFSVEGDDGEREFLEDRSRWGRQDDSGDGGFNDRGQEILNRDICEWDAVDDFLELKVDICVLSFVGGGVLKLRA